MGKVGSYFIYKKIEEHRKDDHNIWGVSKKSLKNLENLLILRHLWSNMVTQWRKVELKYHNVV
jgi:hypothetical protein